MSRYARVAWRLAALLALLGAAAAPARAEDYETVAIDQNVGSHDTYRVRARVLGIPVLDRVGGFGYVRIEIVNPTAKPHAVVATLGGGGRASECRIRRSARVEPESTAVVELPLLGSRWGMALRFTCDGVAARAEMRVGGGGYARRRGAGLAVLLVGGAGDAGAWPLFVSGALSEVGADPRGGIVLPLEPRDLPGTWTYLSAFDLVVVDAAREGLTVEQQELLVRYAAGGGALVVHGLGKETEGPLAGLREDGGEGAFTAGRVGLGRWIAFSYAVEPTSSVLSDWLAEGRAHDLGLLGGLRRDAGGGAPAAFWWPLEIPGLGEVPVRAFFLLILAFVLLVGPVSYVWFRRRRRLPMLLVTIPALGFLCTAAILGYGFFSEGFGVIGAGRTFSVLDQATKQAAVACGSTLYAGLQPSRLAPSVDTWLATPAFDVDDHGRDGTHAFRADLDAGFRIEGSLLPSRTPTAFVSTTVGRSRERLRFRRHADGGYEVLATSGFHPVSRPGAILLRTKAGAFYLGDAAGRLRPLDVEDGVPAAAIDALLAAADRLPLGTGSVIADRYYGTRPEWVTRQAIAARAAGSASLGDFVRERLEGFPRGHYLAAVNRPPLDETFGLEVEWRHREHVVLGKLGEEDVIDD